MGHRQFFFEPANLHFKFCDLAICLADTRGQRRLRAITRRVRERFPLCALLLQTLLQFREHLFKVGDATLLYLSSLAGFPGTLVERIPILRPRLYRILSRPERFARLLRTGL